MAGKKPSSTTYPLPYKAAPFPPLGFSLPSSLFTAVARSLLPLQFLLSVPHHRHHVRPLGAAIGHLAVPFSDDYPRERNLLASLNLSAPKIFPEHHRRAAAVHVFAASVGSCLASPSDSSEATSSKNAR